MDYFFLLCIATFILDETKKINMFQAINNGLEIALEKNPSSGNNKLLMFIILFYKFTDTK